MGDMELRCEQYDDGWCADHASTSTDPAKGCDYARMVAAEAAVQRVREVCDNEDYGRIFAEYGPDAEVIRVVPLDAVLNALDGDGDE